MPHSDSRNSHNSGDSGSAAAAAQSLTPPPPLSLASLWPHLRLHAPAQPLPASAPVSAPIATDNYASLAAAAASAELDSAAHVSSQAAASTPVSECEPDLAESAEDARAREQARALASRQCLYPSLAALLTSSLEAQRWVGALVNVRLARLILADVFLYVNHD